MRVLLVGGGTGGHITPLLAVAHELKSMYPTIEVNAVTDSGTKFSFLLHDCKDIDSVHVISAGKYRRYPNEKFYKKLTDVKTVSLNIRDALRTVKGFRQALRILRQQKPDVIFIKGGFVGVPLGVAARILKIPFITHDSDTVPGLANRLIGRWAKKHAVGMPEQFYSYPRKKTQYTGTPVPAEYQLVSERQRSALKQELGYRHATPIVLVIGGSQGARQLNTAVEGLRRYLPKESSLVIMHQTGSNNKKPKDNSHYKSFAFSKELYKYSAAADVVIARAGASTIAELAVQGRAVILVPSPNLTGGHQVKNARHLAEQGAALYLEEKQILQHPELLLQSIQTILANPSIKQRYEQCINTLAKPQAAREIAQLIIELA